MQPLSRSTDIARYLDISDATVRRKCASGEWPARKVGKSYRFTPDDLARILELCAVPARPTHVDVPGQLELPA